MFAWVDAHEAGESEPGAQLTSCASGESKVCFDSLQLAGLLLPLMKNAAWWSPQWAVGLWQVRADSTLPDLKEECTKSVSFIGFCCGKS